jgi:acyl-CoA dehydrogenase
MIAERECVSSDTLIRMNQDTTPAAALGAFWKSEHLELQAKIRALTAKQILPNIERWDAEAVFPIDLLRAMGREGYLGVDMPIKYGGGGMDAVSACIISEEVAQAGGGINATLIVQGVIAIHPIFKLGSEEQKQTHLRQAIRGEKIAAIAMTEPEAGSDVAGIQTSARRDGDEYVINGSKMFITNGTICDFVIIAARTAETEDPHRGLSLILVERGTPGFETVRKLDKLGWRASDTGELRFTNCRVPVANLIGVENRGFYDLMQNLDIERTVFAADCVGLAQAAYEAAAQRARVRMQFGRRIAEFQDIRTLIVDMHVRIEAARLLTYRAAWMIDQGCRATLEVSEAKYFASETAREVTRDAVQVFGGAGFMMDADVQRYYRDAPVLTIGAGTSEIQRQIIAGQLRL